MSRSAQPGEKTAGAPGRFSPRAPRFSALPPVAPSRALLRFFDTYLQFFVRRHFHALRLAGGEHWRQARRPLIVCLNHPSWWDPLVSILLSRALERDSAHYAPMDEIAFARYGILRRLGLFPVEQGTRRGAVQFMRGAAHILADPGAVLWLTPQGGFTDARTRPVVFRGGLDALIRSLPQVTVLPLAIEYTFWDERLPEALALLGEPLEFNSANAVQGGAGAQVEAALQQAQDRLALLSAQRDPSLFTSIVAGSAGTSGIYGAWQRLRALARGDRFHAEHASLQPENSREALRGTFRGTDA